VNIGTYRLSKRRVCGKAASRCYRIVLENAFSAASIREPSSTIKGDALNPKNTQLTCHTTYLHSVCACGFCVCQCILICVCIWIHVYVYGYVHADRAIYKRCLRSPVNALLRHCPHPPVEPLHFPHPNFGHFTCLYLNFFWSIFAFVHRIGSYRPSTYRPSVHRIGSYRFVSVRIGSYR
jgi:hypothetical protein